MRRERGGTSLETALQDRSEQGAAIRKHTKSSQVRGQATDIVIQIAGLCTQSPIQMIRRAREAAEH